MYVVATVVGAAVTAFDRVYSANVPRPFELVGWYTPEFYARLLPMLPWMALSVTLYGLCAVVSWHVRRRRDGVRVEIERRDRGN
jgi:hypothetical protein